MTTTAKSQLGFTINMPYVLTFAAGIIAFFFSVYASDRTQSVLKTSLHANLAATTAASMVSGAIVYGLGLAMVIFLTRFIGSRPSLWSLTLGATVASGFLLIEELMVFVYIHQSQVPSNMLTSLSLVFFASFGVLYAIGLWVSENLAEPARKRRRRA